MDKTRWKLRVVVAAAVAVALSGCTPAGVPALERTATPADVLPANMNGTGGFDPDTARHVATRDGVAYYLAKQTGDVTDGVCLIVTLKTEPVQWASSCGFGEWFGLEWAPGKVNAEFHRHSLTAGDVKPGWSQLSENVTVEGASTS